MRQFRKLSAILLALVLMLSLMSGCKPREGSESSSEPSSESSVSQLPPSSSDIEIEVEPGEPVSSITPDYSEDIATLKKRNSDSVGWLMVPGTPIDDVVVHKPSDKTNEYYLRLNIDQKYDFNGLYYADARALFGDGTREGLGVNTCIYGHAMTDVPEAAKFGIKFGPLHKFRDPEFAKEHPYIFFSSEKENMAFEVIAVFVANADNLALPYNGNPASGADFVKMIEKEVFPRSKYLYDVELKDTDKFLTLSTCIYTLDNGVQTGYPNTYYRYAVMARLLPPDAVLKQEADFTENTDVVYDPDGRWKNQ